MKNPWRFLRPKRRHYPIQIDDEGKSIRKRCFEAFDRRKRPAQVILEYGFLRNTVYTYWKQWKKLPDNWHNRREHLKLAKKVDPDFFTEAAYQAGKKLGMSRLEVLAHLERPYGLLGLIQGNWPLYDTAPATNEAITVLQDLVKTVFWDGFRREHPRNIVRNLEADGIDFTEKRIRLRTQELFDKPDDIKNKSQTDEKDFDGQ